METKTRNMKNESELMSKKGILSEEELLKVSAAGNFDECSAKCEHLKRESSDLAIRCFKQCMYS